MEEDREMTENEVLSAEVEKLKLSKSKRSLQTQLKTLNAIDRLVEQGKYDETGNLVKIFEACEVY